MSPVRGIFVNAHRVFFIGLSATSAFNLELDCNRKSEEEKVAGPHLTWPLPFSTLCGLSGYRSSVSRYVLVSVSANSPVQSSLAIPALPDEPKSGFWLPLSPSI